MRRFSLFFSLLSVAFLTVFSFGFTPLEAKLPDIDATDVTNKTREIMRAHASYKKLDEELMRRTLVNYIDELDPSKVYFIEPDIQIYLNPSSELLNAVLNDFSKSKFPVFEEINSQYIKAIERRTRLETEIENLPLPQNVTVDSFKDLNWAQNIDELKERLLKLKALQIDAAAKLSDDEKPQALQRIQKRRLKREEKYISNNPVEVKHQIYSNILKAFAASLDSHTCYFTPDEASQFMIAVQQRLLGIGVQLRDDLNGFTVTKIIEGGPAFRAGNLKVSDKIIAVGGEPVVGMEITDAVSLIRGEEGTNVTLTVLRPTNDGKQEKLDVIIERGEVVLKDARIETTYEPYGDGIIAHIKLFSFYQDPHYSSASDIYEAISNLKNEHKVNGVILDLRFNSGGLLPQAVAVTGLFISKGIVVSIKDHRGDVQHLRDTDDKMIWDGPLIVLTNRVSASAAEIVAQALQDYGRAIIVGDDHTYGKGTFQTFTLDASTSKVNPKGEYKVTRGRYYTVSGKSPQLVGVASDILVPSGLSQLEIGEEYSKYPLSTDSIGPNFDDDLSDIPYNERERVSWLYKFNLQPKLTLYTNFIATLRKNSEYRQKGNKMFQRFLEEVKKQDPDTEPTEMFLENDLQLEETYNIMRDLIYLLKEQNPAAAA